MPNPDGHWVRAYIGLGSNLDEPRMQIQRAIQALAELQSCRLIKVSRLYLSEPLGPAEQPNYINAVAALDTCLKPLALLDRLQGIEQAQGRQRLERWGPRTLDLDLLLHGNHQFWSERLTLPHPEMCVRPFVLYPLADIAPDLILPNGQPLSSVLAACPSGSLRPLEL